MKSLLKLKDKIVAKVFRILTLNWIFPRTYKKAAKKPVDDNKIVFVEIRLPSVSNSLKVIFDKLVSEYDFDVHMHFLLTNSQRRYKYLRRCKEMLVDIATAKYIVISDSTNCIGSVDLRKESELVQLWHGCGAFKKFGLSTADLIFGESRKEQEKHPTNNNDTYITVSSPEVIWAYEEAMNPDKKDAVVATGCSRTDVFYDKDFIDTAYENLYDIVPQAYGKKIILYAPTFRGRVARAQTSTMLNLKMFYDKLGDDYFVLFKHHPLVKAKSIPGIPAKYSNFAADVSKSMTIEDLLCVSDICITDYSSLVYEYSLFEKPIIFFAYDLDSYFDWRGFYYDYYEMSPGPVCTTNLEMINYIQNLDTEFDKQRVKDFRYKFMRSCDGNATNRILETVIGKDILEKHKKENDGILPFDLVPTSDEYFSDYLTSVKTLKKDCIKYNKEFNKYNNNAIVQKKIVLLDCSQTLCNLIQEYCPEAVILTASDMSNKKNRSNILKELATASFVFVEENIPLLNLLKLKEDTKVVYVQKNSLPFEKFGKATLAYKSGFYKELHKIAPLYNKVDVACISSEACKDIYQESLGKAESIFAYCGDLKTDCLYKEELKAEAMEKLKTAFDESVSFKGKKILLDFSARKSRLVPSYESICDNYLYEYLKDDYIIIKYFCNIGDGNKKKFVHSNAMKAHPNEMIDVTSVLTEYEAIAVADVIVGSINDDFFASFATGKPVFAYAPYYRRRLHGLQTNFKYDEVLPCDIYTEPDDLAQAILDVEHYNFDKLNKYNETYINNPDGKSTERLLKKLGLIEE